MLTKEDAITALKNVKDPELDIDVYTLGLIYDITIKEENVIHIKMTLTTPFCPLVGPIKADIKAKLQEAGFKNPELEVVFDPPWEPTEAIKRLIELKFREK